MISVQVQVKNPEETKGLQATIPEGMLIGLILRDMQALMNSCLKEVMDQVGGFGDNYRVEIVERGNDGVHD